MVKERKEQWLVNFKQRESYKNKRKNCKDFIFFDTETKQVKSDKTIGTKTYPTIVNTLDIGWACHYNLDSDKETWWYFENLDSLYYFIDDVIAKTDYKPLWLVAHNIVFDAIITDIWKHLKDKKFESEFLHVKGMTFIQKLKKTNPNGRTDKIITLVNNGNVFPAPLAVIGDTVGVKKGNWEEIQEDFEKIIRPYNIENKTIIEVLNSEIHFDYKTRVQLEHIKQTYINYCRTDVKILVEFWKQWSRFLFDNDLGAVKYTVSSQSFEAFRRKYCKHFIKIEGDLEHIAFERLAYYGGRTQIFHQGKVRKKIYYYDVNSMYPYVMKSFLYPREFAFRKDNPSIQYLQYMVEKNYTVVAECTIKTENDCYPLKRDNGSLYFPISKITDDGDLEEFKVHLCTPEILIAIEQGDLVSIGRCHFYKSANLFEEYINFFYNKRVELKKAGNSQEALFKLFLNSLYGKFGAMMDEWRIATEEEIQDIDSNFTLEKFIMNDYLPEKLLIEGVDITPKIRYLAGELQLAGEREEWNLSFPALAGHVTSYSRLVIWQAMKWCKQNNVKYYYCDTDSIFIEAELPPEMVDNNELGKFKVEKIYEYGVEFMNLKNYCPLTINGHKYVEDKKGNKIEIAEDESVIVDNLHKGKGWKLKGIPKDAILKDAKTFLCQEWGGLPKQTYYERFGRAAGEFWIIEKKKEIKNKIKKGNLQFDGTILPIRLDQYDIKIMTDNEKILQEIKQLKRLKNCKVENPILDIVRGYNGVKHYKNGAYKEELKRLKAPIRNFRSGSTVDIVCEAVNDTLGLSFSINDFIEYLENIKDNKDYIKKQIEMLYARLTEVTEGEELPW